MFEHANATTMLAVKDLDRARAFYEQVLGLTPVGPQGGATRQGDVAVMSMAGAVEGATERGS
jgi:catechol 2,3-dioxygenase-like lactoylglutathione lyase family enzyme